MRILTAPSGYAFDLMPPLARIARADPGLATQVRLLASDLDPSGQFEAEIAQKTRAAGAAFEFVRGDLTTREWMERIAQDAPYDLVLFVGLSSWLPKPHLVNHFRFIRERLLAKDGALISDCFTPDGYSLSGKYAGYKANYYTPRDYSNILAYCGFDPQKISWQSGAEGINHVCVARVGE